MRKGIFLFVLMTPLLLLSGCFGGGEDQKLLDLALTIRGEYLAMESFSAAAELTADYGQRVYTYSLDAAAQGEELRLTILRPDIVSGITARINPDGGFLEYDDMSVETGPLTDEGLSPISAIPALLEQLRSGYITAWSSEQDGSFRITCGDPNVPPSMGTAYDLWFDPDSHALLRGEVSTDGRRCIQCIFSSFTKE